jgi:formylmethanofuran dehydrogenase subunit C
VSVRLTLRAAPTVRLEASCVRPDGLAALTEAEIAGLTVWHGREETRLGEFFDVKGGRSDDVRISGDLERITHLGAAMAGGRLIVEGRAGLHTGAGMAGGDLRIEGDADDYTGAEMKGGLIEVGGGAGAQLGGAYTGSVCGMTGGTILVRGTSGDHTGERMRRGLIAVAGDAGPYVAARMIAGTVVVCGNPGPGPGIGMKRGTLVAGGTLELLPTFRYACTYRPGFLGLLFGSLEAHGFALPERFSSGSFRRYGGDFADRGRGEILQWTSQSAAAH